MTQTREERINEIRIDLNNLYEMNLTDEISDEITVLEAELEELQTEEFESLDFSDSAMRADSFEAGRKAEAETKERLESDTINAEVKKIFCEAWSMNNKPNSFIIGFPCFRMKMQGVPILAEKIENIMKIYDYALDTTYANGKEFIATFKKNV